MKRARQTLFAVMISFGICCAPAAGAVGATTPEPSPAASSLNPSESPVQSSPTVTETVTATATPSPYDPGPRPIRIAEVSAVALTKNPPLYQVKWAPLAIAPNELETVIAALNAAGTPMFVSILAGNGDQANGSARLVQEQMRTKGTFLTIVGTVYDTFSTEFDSQALLAQAFAEQRSNGTAAVIIRFADLSSQAAKGPIPTPDQIAWRPTLIIIGVVLVGGFGYLILRARLERRQAAKESAPPDGSVDLPSSS